MSRAELRDVDMATIHEGNPLMEGVIHHVFAKASDIARRPDVLHFLDPAVAHTMYAFRDAALGPVEEMCGKLLLVIPIAEYDSASSNGGHWSTLVLLRASAEMPFSAFRLDSLYDKNKELCASFLEMLHRCSPCGDCIPLCSEAVDFPSQENSTDCGCFVCLAALHIASGVQKKGVCDTLLTFPPSWDTSQFRRALLEEVQEKGIP
ncbi:putative SUMO1/Ulp2 [Trypanosoma grayi]|uniref:putative SUMO1/Ulp2 n=1 Tax=Trypanosoma grayi TaxID=71804 RepID=UPI0004F41F08|nr:putative SUMO1/Ulp2 [Trypanosoma grayi]KEG07500.1 putative SUMO1/Ulp2 [Trypanosoma grayi]